MTFALHGIGVSRGTAIGNVHILHREVPESPYYPIAKENVEDEVKRYQNAISNASQQLQNIRQRIPDSTPADIAEFIDTHLLMLQDATLTKRPVEIIRQEGCNAEWALKLQSDALCKVFDEMDDAYLRTRRDDVAHVVNRIQVNLTKQVPQHHESEKNQMSGRIIIADDLSPADVITLQHQRISGFVTEFGGPTSHSAILARNLGLPAIVGVHGARHYLRENEELILDGLRGVLLANTPPNGVTYYQQRTKQERIAQADLQELRSKRSVSRDNYPIELLANIELNEDLPAVHDAGCAGIGLYRTEFMFMNRNSPPSEEEHLAAYLNILQALNGQVLTIRTLDLGSDKQADFTSGRSVASNPALGLRAIRLCLKEPGLFLPQLRAILRASAFGKVEIMIPMISTLLEVQQIHQIIGMVKRSLDLDGIDYDNTIPIGGMIEVPAAALCANVFAEELDFLSIGTNDLIQYTLAIDRVDDEVNYLYDPLHPAVLKLIQTVIDAGHNANIPVSMCGEMAGDPRYTKLLLGMGLTRFSMHPASLLTVKQLILNTDCEPLRRRVPKVIHRSVPAEINALMQSL